MNRREVLKAVGLASIGASVSLAGCSDDGEGGSLEVTNVDTDSVDEPDTVFMTASVENSGDESATDTLLGEVESDDVVHEQRREVTVDGGAEADFNLKFRYDTGLIDVFTPSASIESDPEAESANSVGFHDLIVVEFDGPTEDGIEAGRPTMTVTVENRGDGERTATIEAEVTISDNGYTEQQDVTLPAGESDEISIQVDAPEPSGVYTYNGSVQFPEQ